DVVGQWTDVLVAHNRYGPTGRRTTLRILYAEGGERDACLARDALLIDDASTEDPDRETIHATTPLLHPAPVSPPRPGSPHRVAPGRPARARGPAMGP